MTNILKKQSVRFLGVGMLLVCMALLGVFAQGCSSDFDSDVTIKNLDIPKEYNEVGILHNEGLEYIFEELKAYGIEYMKNPRLKSRPFMENNDEFIKQATLNFCNQHEKLRKYGDILTHVLKDIPSLKSSSEEKNSPSVQQLLDKIATVFNQEFKEKELSRLKEQLDVINQQAAQTLSETDASIIYCATSTGYHSYQYWMNNYKKWYFALNYPEILEQYNNEELNQLQLKNGIIRTKGWWDNMWNTVESWWDSVSDAVNNWWNNGGADIVNADASGAAGGALTGLITGAGAIPGAIASGLAGSAKEAVETYLDMWWGN
jgi:AraC-like DNA-binding protein